MKRVRSRVASACALMEALEQREMLSAVPFVFHAMKGLNNPAVSRVRVAGLFSGATGGTYTYTLPSASSLSLISPEQVGSFFSTAAIGNITAIIDWGDGSSSAGTIGKLSGHAGNGKQFGVDGMHQYASSGTFTVVVHVTVHGAAGTVKQDIHAAGQVTDAPPVVIDPLQGLNRYFYGNNFNEIAGEPAPFGIDVAQTNETLTNVMIDWGDGTAPTPGTVTMNAVFLNASSSILVFPRPIFFGPSYPPYFVEGNHVYATPGTYTVTITADESPSVIIVGPTAGTTSTAAPHFSTTATATVAENSPDGGNFVGAPNVPTQVLAGFIDLGPDKVRGMIDWGDGTSSPGTLVPNGTDTDGNAAYAVAGSHAYAQAGSYRVTTTVYYLTGGGSIDTTFSTALITAPVAEAAPVVQPTTSDGETNFALALSLANMPGIQIGGADKSLHLTLINSPDIQFSATIDWGDGTVEPANLVPPIEGGILSQTETLPATNGILPLGFPSLEISGSHAYATDGTYNVTLTVTELYTPTMGAPQASMATFQGQADIPAPTDQPVQITASDSSAHLQASVPVSQLPLITLPSNGGNVIQLLPSVAVTYTATIDWGDGTTSAAGVEVPPELTGISIGPVPLPGTGIIVDDAPVILMGDHQYAAMGTFQVTITLTATYTPDDGGPTSSAFKTLQGIAEIF